MKVAILSPYPTFPFAKELGCPSLTYQNNATWTVALAKGLAAIPDTQVHVVTEAENIPASRTIVDADVKLHFLKVPSHFKTLTLWQTDRWRIGRVLAEVEPDIVHGQGIENQYGFAAITSKYPHLLTIHGIPHLANASQHRKPFSREWLVQLFAQYTLKKARNVVTIDPFVEQCYPQLHTGKRLFPIPNALNELFFNTPPIAREPGLILSVGYVERRKAHDVLAAALALLPSTIAPRLVIAGPLDNSEHVRGLKEFVSQHRLKVEFTGFVGPEEVRILMQRCTMFVLPSRHETAPVALCEAMALKTPVIASSVGGAPNMIRDGETGLLFESENHGELADKIQLLLENESMRRHLADAAGQVAREKYHPREVARLTRAAYEEVLMRGKGS